MLRKGLNLFFEATVSFLAQKFMMARVFKTSVLNGQTCLSLKLPEKLKASCLTTDPAYIFGR